MPKNLVLNIGLNVGTQEPDNQLKETINRLQGCYSFNPTEIIVQEGEWEGEKERVMVVALNVGDAKKDLVDMILSNLCITLYQDAIAYKLNGIGHLAYSPLYTRDEIEFSEEFFINL